MPENYIKRVIQFARQGYTDDRLPDLRHRLGFGGLPHRLRPELQQFRPRHRRFPARRRERRRLEAHRPQGRQGDEDAEGARPLGEDRLRRLGLGRSRPPVPHHDQRLAHLRRPAAPISALEPVLGIHVPRRHGLQPRLAQPPAVPQRATARFDIAAFEHAVRLWTIVLEISVMMAQFPSKEIAELSYEYRTLGLGYANIGGLLMTSGIPYDSTEGRAICGALTALMTGIAYATSAEMAGELGAFPDYDRNRERHAPRHAQPPPRRLRRQRRLREARRSARCRSIARRPAADQSSVEHATRRLGPRPRARRGARLPQRPGDRHRADRHDRPRHGLRHHRHRARLRAGEVQEARRRRLLQDHQPRRARGAAHARLLARPRSPRSRPMRSATATSTRRPASTPTRSRPRASPTRRSPRSTPRSARPSTSSSSSTSGRSARTS